MPLQTDQEPLQSKIEKLTQNVTWKCLAHV